MNNGNFKTCHVYSSWTNNIFIFLQEKVLVVSNVTWLAVDLICWNVGEKKSIFCLMMDNLNNCGLNYSNPENISMRWYESYSKYFILIVVSLDTFGAYDSDPMWSMENAAFLQSTTRLDMWPWCSKWIHNWLLVATAWLQETKSRRNSKPSYTRCATSTWSSKVAQPLGQTNKIQWVVYRTTHG